MLTNQSSSINSLRTQDGLPWDDRKIGCKTFETTFLANLRYLTLPLSTVCDVYSYSLSPSTYGAMQETQKVLQGKLGPQLHELTLCPEREYSGYVYHSRTRRFLLIEQSISACRVLSAVRQITILLNVTSAAPGYRARVNIESKDALSDAVAGKKGVRVIFRQLREHSERSSLGREMSLLKNWRGYSLIRCVRKD